VASRSSAKRPATFVTHDGKSLTPNQGENVVVRTSVAPQGEADLGK
jgi:hypothetical protein